MKLAYIFYGVGAYLLLLVLFALCLCCTPGNKEIRKDFYNRMKVYDDWIFIFLFSQINWYNLICLFLNLLL